MVGIESTILGLVKEIVLFDIWEGFLFLMLYLIDLKIRINKSQFVFHVVILGVLDGFICNIVNFPIFMQIALILGLSFYLSMVTKTNYIKGTIIMTKNFFTLFIIEMALCAIYQHLFNINIVSIDNDFTKFKYMLVFKFVEIIFIYIYYKMKGGEVNHEKNINSNV